MRIQHLESMPRAVWMIVKHLWGNHRNDQYVEILLGSESGDAKETLRIDLMKKVGHLIVKEKPKRILTIVAHKPTDPAA